MVRESWLGMNFTTDRSFATAILALMWMGGWLAAHAQSTDVIVEIDFNTDPVQANRYVETGNGAAYWWPDRGASGAAGDGFLALTDARGGQESCLAFNHTPATADLVIEAFKFAADLRIGGGSARPAHGFSISFVRDPSALLSHAANGVDPSYLDFNPTDIETSVPEEGAREGLGIGFDVWESGTIGNVTDVVGLSIRYNQEIIAQFPVPLQPGNFFPGGQYDEAPYRNLATNDVAYQFSLQTGALNPLTADSPQHSPESPTWVDWVKNLAWEKFRCEMNADGFLKVFWKGVELTPAGGLKTPFAPTKARLVLAGRTGGNNGQVQHFDNIKLILNPIDLPFWGTVIGNPVGFETTIADSGLGFLDPATLEVTLDGVPIAPRSVVSAGGITTILAFDLNAPLTPGSLHKVVLRARATHGAEIMGSGAEKEFTVPSYVTVPPSLAATPDTGRPGFLVRWHQVSMPQEYTVDRAEQQLYGRRGPNHFPAGGVEEVPGVINFEQAGVAAGSWTAAIEPAGAYADTPIPLPNPTYTDNLAAAIETYVVFPEAGIYYLLFDSDDGSRTTLGANVADVQSSILVSQSDVGRGATGAFATLYVPLAGAYPLRTVWYEGTGSAHGEWSGAQALPTVMPRALLNDPHRPSLKTYRARTDPAPAGVSFVHPFRGIGGTGVRYLPTAPIIAELTPGADVIDLNSIKLSLNGREVTPTVTAGAGTITLRCQPPTQLPAGANSVKIEFTTAAQTYVGEHVFMVRAVPVVAANLALPPSVVDRASAGFLVKVRQQNSGYSMVNDTYRGLVQAAGLFGFPNTADPAPFTSPGGYYPERAQINYTATGDDGYFDGRLGFPDSAVPGIPGSAAADGGTDNYSVAVLTVLELPAGIHAMKLNSDDGFWLAFGNPAEVWTFPAVVGEFSGGRGQGGGFFDGTTFYFEIKQAGLYPVRLVCYEGGGDSGLEWSSFTIDGNGLLGSQQLINDRDAPDHVKAYEYPRAALGSPYVRSFRPGRSNRASAAAPARASRFTDVSLEIVDGDGWVDPGTIGMTINGVPVTPTATKAAGVTTVLYAPAAPFAPGEPSDVAVTFGDRTVRWQFATADIGVPVFFIEAEDFNTGGGQAPSATSVMPYAGGALAGLSAVHDVDYHRGVDPITPSIYRLDEDPNVPMDRTTDRDRGFLDLAVNYKIGWDGTGQWYNYTRTFPNGHYHVFAGLSHGGLPDSGRVGGRLARITSDPSRPGQSIEDLGVFDAPRTGGWGNNALVPLRDATHAPVTLALSGQQTLRFTTLDGDFDFLLFTAAPPALKISAVNAVDGQVTITWTGRGVLEASPTLGPAAVWTSTGDDDGSHIATAGPGQGYFRVRERR